ncbi:MAG TPA: GNAT family N-acetyltransferase [Firmicutes bacterium]|nr:GNAT family N-acetyltransferase [Bacillota bacterium]
MDEAMQRLLAGVRLENTPELHTERLILRRFRPTDGPALFRLLSDREVNRFLPWFPLETQAQADEWLQTFYLDFYRNEPWGCRYALCQKEEDVPVGYIHVAPNPSLDLGYALAKEHWHKGFVTEGCRAVVQRLREQGLPYLTATHDVNNPRSGAVMERLGMTFRYNYQEQWQPKNILVTFRLYKIDLAGSARVRSGGQP